MNTKKQFIVKEGASLYYLNNDGMGGFLNPPTRNTDTALSNAAAGMK